MRGRSVSVSGSVWVSAAVVVAAIACRSRDERALEEIDRAIAAASPSARPPGADDPRDADDRRPARLARTPAPWRPFRASQMVATRDALLLSHDAGAGSSAVTRLAIAQPDRPDRALLEVPATNFLDPLALDDRFAYFNRRSERDPDGNRATRFQRVPRGGGAVEELGAGAGPVALAGDLIYYSTGGGQYVHAPFAELHARHRVTGAVTRLRGPNTETVLSLAVAGNQLYVLVQEQPARSLDRRPGHLLALPLDATGAPAGAIAELAAFPTDRPRELAALGDTLYYVTEGVALRDDGTLCRWDPAARRGTVLARGLALPGHLTAGAGHLCFYLMRERSVREVLCHRVATGKLVTVASSAGDNLLQTPVLLGARVLWSEGGVTTPGRLMSVELEP